MVALEAKYHTKCLVDLHDRAQKAKAKDVAKGTNEVKIISRTVLILQNRYISKKYVIMNL